MKTTPPLPPDIIAALIYVRTHFGRNAKGLIRDAWLTGNYWFAREHDGALQCLRNYYGGAPTLARITMAAL
jgi:hypothetical protein